MIVGILQNVALLLAMAFVYDVVVPRRVSAPTSRTTTLAIDVLTGLVLGLVGVGVMASSWEVQDGVFIDTRSVMLAAVGLFFGVVPAAAAVVLTAAYRLTLGGAGVPTGVAVILVTCSIGVLARRGRSHRLERLEWRELAVIGVVVHVAMLATFVLVPFEGSSEVVRDIAVPVMLLYPPAFVLVAILLSRRLRSATMAQLLAESEERYRTVFDNQHLVMMIIDPEGGQVTDVNRRATEFYGWSRDEMLAMKASDFEVLPRDEVLRQIDEGNARQVKLFDFQHRLASGEIRDVEVLGGLIRIDGNDRVHVVINDTTERKRAECALESAHEQLRHAQKMEAVGRLAGGIAHDFNNMLQVILGYTDLSLADAQGDSALQEYLDEIHRAASRSADLTRQLLAFARKSPVRLEVVDLSATVAGSVRMLRRLVGEDVEVDWSFAHDLWPVEIDTGQLEQVLTNLALNARAAIDTGGKLTISGRNVRVVDIQADDPPETKLGEFVQLTVADDGHGMHAELLGSIFEPFFTTRGSNGGTGLGLSIVDGIVAQHGGFIRVDSAPGAGTTFRLHFPRSTRPHQSADPMVEVVGGAHAPSRATGLVVLLVEDEPSVLRLGEQILSTSGYRVLTASDGETALEVARSHADSIDLVVTDVVMPGLDVREFVRRLREERPAICVLYVSGYAEDAITARGAIDAGADLLAKPYSAGDLLMRVEATLGAQDRI